MASVRGQGRQAGPNFVDRLGTATSNGYRLAWFVIGQTSLLAARLRVERQPNEVTGLGYLGRAHQDSSPCGRPQSWEVQLLTSDGIDLVPMLFI